MKVHDQCVITGSSSGRYEDGPLMLGLGPLYPRDTIVTRSTTLFGTLTVSSLSDRWDYLLFFRCFSSTTAIIVYWEFKSSNFFIYE